MVILFFLFRRSYSKFMHKKWEDQLSNEQKNAINYSHYYYHSSEEENHEYSKNKQRDESGESLVRHDC